MGHTKDASLESAKQKRTQVGQHVGSRQESVCVGFQSMHRAFSTVIDLRDSL